MREPARDPLADALAGEPLAAILGIDQPAPSLIAVGARTITALDHLTPTHLHGQLVAIASSLLPPLAGTSDGWLWGRTTRDRDRYAMCEDVDGVNPADLPTLAMPLGAIVAVARVRGATVDTVEFGDVRPLARPVPLGDVRRGWTLTTEDAA